MKCPYCASSDSKVVDKRESEDLAVTRRRRQCLGCQKRYTTYERVESIPLTIIKKDGNRQQFDRQKLMIGIMRACEKRPISNKDIEALIDSIENELRSLGASEIPSAKVGTIVIEKLKGMDDVAYVRFASVYRDFKDANQFIDELNQYIQKKK